jgi:ADP-heptose:LPS heptosyltransferase
LVDERVFEKLQISDRRERWAVGLGDAGLAVAMAALRPFGGQRPAAHPPRRILLLRLERIGDLLMARPAIAAVRRLVPDATIDLVVGSWNEPIARLLEEVDRVETLDARWLARGAPAPGFASLLARARAWRPTRYDLAINFEGDIRSHLLMACSGASSRAGFDMAGGGPLLTCRVPYDPTRHVADNLLRLVEHALDVPRGSLQRTEERLKVPPEARARAESLLAGGGQGVPGPRRTGAEPERPLSIGIQVGGGRVVKQWDPARFGVLAARLAERYPVQIVFTGSADDRRLVAAALAHVPTHVPVVDVCGQVDLPTLAALLERFAVFITGDTGPMHLAAAVATPLVAIFGPSDPRRWGPLSSTARIVRSDVACGPCNQIRRPPARCSDALADCLAAIDVDQVLEAVEQQLAARTGAAVETPDGRG